MPKMTSLYVSYLDLSDADGTQPPHPVHGLRGVLLTAHSEITPAVSNGVLRNVNAGVATALVGIHDANIYMSRWMARLRRRSFSS